MGSLRNLFKNTLPSLASLWPDSNIGGDTERADIDPLYSQEQKQRESTYEMMRECPEIIEEVVEMRYNTGTIVKPHLRNGRNSAQQLFEVPLDDAAGDAREGGSDSGVSSKNSEVGDVYAIPKRKSRAAPQPPKVCTSSSGLYENPLLSADRSLEMYENPMVSDQSSNADYEASVVAAEMPSGVFENPLLSSDEFYSNMDIVKQNRENNRVTASKRSHKDISGTGNNPKRSKKKPMPSPKPENLRPQRKTGVVATESPKLRTESPRVPQKAVAFSTGVKENDFMGQKTRSLQNLQQCFPEVDVPKPKIKTKKSFRLHPKPRYEMTAEELARSPGTPALQQAINDNFLLMPSQHFPTRQPTFKPPIGDRRDILNDSIEVVCTTDSESSSDADGNDDSDDEVENDELEIDAAIDEALAAETMSVSQDSDSGAAQLPLEPLYVNRQDVRQELIADLRQRQSELELERQHLELTTSSRPGSAIDEDLFHAVPIEITSMDTLPKPKVSPKSQIRAEQKEYGTLELPKLRPMSSSTLQEDEEGRSARTPEPPIPKRVPKSHNIEDWQDPRTVPEHEESKSKLPVPTLVQDTDEQNEPLCEAFQGGLHDVSFLSSENGTLLKADESSSVLLKDELEEDIADIRNTSSDSIVTTPADPPDTYITLNLKDHRSPRASTSQPPHAYRRAPRLRKASSMSDLLPAVLRGGKSSRERGPAPLLPNTMSLDTATRLEAAHRSLRNHTQQRQSRPASAASSAYLTAWLTLSAACATLRRWVCAAGGAVGGVVASASAPLLDWVGIKYMSFHRNHPWLPDLVSQPDLDYWVRRTKKGSNGFEELRKYIKHGGDFCKELASILQERSDLEVSYAKSLQKLSSKLLKASKEGLGSVNQAWQMVGAEMEYEADIHKTLAVAYTEELVKPLKGLMDTQHKVRKSVEGMVDKTAKNLAEWRSAEAKAKKMSYQCARENEKAEEQALDVRLGRGKHISDKDSNKVEARRQKTGNAMSKADTDYYTFCLRGERARLEWETAVNKGSQCLQALEEERLVRLRSALHAYHQNMRSLGPKMIQSAERLGEPIACADVNRDVQTVINVKGSGHNIPEQMLPDFYAEDMTNVMNRERRRKALEQFLHLMRQGVERERRGKHGVENLAKAINDTPHFGSEGSKKDVHEKLQHMRAMLAYLEASRYKLQAALAELEGRPRPQHPLRKHIEYHKDRQGMTQSILKVPAWVALDPLNLSPDISPTWPADRGKADGTSHQPDSDFDEFSSQGDEREYQLTLTGDPTGGGPSAVSSSSSATQPATPPADSGRSSAPAASPCPVADDATGLVPSIGRCRVLYDYSANMYDELTIRTGDTINVHDKQDDGWWLGELNGTVGIFPATYVEELS